MADDNPVRFTLSDDTSVIVRKMTDNKYDFELRLTNGNRKTFMWSTDSDMSNGFGDRNGYTDGRITEAVLQFRNTLND
jgi:hypothetical protein